METLDPGTRLANLALPLAPCSAFQNQDVYTAALCRPSEGLTTAARAYYLANKALSTCALTVLAVYRLAGIADPILTGPYYPDRVGKAFNDIESLAAKWGAWEAHPDLDAAPLQAGDVFIITDAAGGDAHTGMCVSGMDPSSGAVDTVEGGQFDGRWSTAIGKFTRKLVPSLPAGPAGRVWMMGSRRVYGVVRAARVPLPSPDPA